MFQFLFFMHGPHLSARLIFWVWTNQRLILAEPLTLMINSLVTEQDQTHSSSVAVGWPSPREWVEISVSEIFMSMEFWHVTQQMNPIGYSQTRLPVFNQPQVMGTALTAIVFPLFKNILYWNGWYLYVARYSVQISYGLNAQCLFRAYFAFWQKPLKKVNIGSVNTETTILKQ